MASCSQQLLDAPLVLVALLAVLPDQPAVREPCPDRPACHAPCSGKRGGQGLQVFEESCDEAEEPRQEGEDAREELEQTAESAAGGGGEPAACCVERGDALVLGLVWPQQGLGVVTRGIGADDGAAGADAPGRAHVVQLHAPECQPACPLSEHVAHADLGAELAVVVGSMQGGEDLQQGAAPRAGSGGGLCSLAAGEHFGEGWRDRCAQ